MRQAPVLPADVAAERVAAGSALTSRARTPHLAPRPVVAGQPGIRTHSEQPKGIPVTTALPAPSPRPSQAPRLQLVGDRPPAVPADGGRVGYLVFLPADVDPVALMQAHGVRPQLRPLDPGRLVAVEPEPAPGSAALPAGDTVRVDRARRVAEVDGCELDLTYLEFTLLLHFVTHPYTVHTREALISGIWGYGHVGDGRTVDVHVARLRRKLGPAHRDRISTVRRVGYKYVPAQARQAPSSALSWVPPVAAVRGVVCWTAQPLPSGSEK